VASTSVILPGSIVSTPWVTEAAVMTGSVANPSVGTGSVNSLSWRRNGPDMEIIWHFEQGASATAGTGTYKILIPNGQSVNTTVVNVGSAYTSNGFGNCNVTNGAVNGLGFVVMYDATHFAMIAAAPSASNAGQLVDGGGWFSMDNSGAGTVKYNVQFNIPIQGWS